MYGTIFAFEESPDEPGVLWAGSDDGRIHVTRDDGGSWTGGSWHDSLEGDTWVKVWSGFFLGVQI